MCFYLRVSRALVLNLARRLWTDVADWAVLVKRRCMYRVRRCISRYDDVGPDNTPLEETFCDQSNIGNKRFELILTTYYILMVIE